MQNPVTLYGILSALVNKVSDETVSTGKPVRKQQQRSVITQNKLLDAAIEAFSENGFKGTSTRDIAERAGVHHPLITYHFKNKDQLWRAAADRVFRDFKRAMIMALEDHQNEGPKERMASVIRAYVYYAKDHPTMHKVMVQESSYTNPRLEWLIETHLKPVFEATFVMIEQLQQLGIAVPGNPRMLFSMIRMSSGGLLALGNELRGSSGIDVESKATLDEIADMIIDTFFPGSEGASQGGAS